MKRSDSRGMRLRVETVQPYESPHKSTAANWCLHNEITSELMYDTEVEPR